ncbi:G-protein coupled receptor Mth2-like isoform X2 [Acyrthosiphon pisum]|uniref:G-protein coupled receptors family 2 profile 2 domain-containing protein n=1 Tax=Acyrthosiphon pisum TaxID=7029 RepID=A0A8R2D1V0_ACYPI|nr:G-protein coupled receptor Mth2-like isoform X2 [Acyrthosiphon pisum]|eukprot:XP_016657295.1 PREDICTED: G-protein coupled receptor Mth2-like isoform X2 [Acyrthosiphon pisum]
MPSVVCLALTLFVYITLPYLRNVHGYYVMCYVACELMSFVCSTIKLIKLDDINSPLCIPFGYFLLFSCLTSFCWLNVICFDIYWTIRYNNSINRNTSISVRTIMYHIYCWGFSIIWVCTGYLFQHSKHETLLKLSPDFGHRSCWFKEHNGYGVLIFYLVPSCIMMTVNFILFLLTAIHFSRIKSELNEFQQTDDSKTEMFFVYKDRFVMTIKLFLVMGIPYLFKILQMIFRIHWIISDLLRPINRVHGVTIFIILVAKRKIILDLQNKFQRFNRSE